MRLFSLVVLAIAAVTPAAVAAQNTKPPVAAAQTTTAEQEDERFEESIRDFGFVSGAAYQCLPAADRPAHDREVLTAYSGLVRLFGSDRAFFYAAAFGAGTGFAIDKGKCDDYVRDFKAAIKAGARGG